jgi:hypothetical protein
MRRPPAPTATRKEAMKAHGKRPQILRHGHTAQRRKTIPPRAIMVLPMPAPDWLGTCAAVSGWVESKKMVAAPSGMIDLMAMTASILSIAPYMLCCMMFLLVGLVGAVMVVGAGLGAGGLGRRGRCCRRRRRRRGVGPR